jgi:hypothetical protein
MNNHSSLDNLQLKMRPPHCLKISGTNHPLMRSNISEDRRPQHTVDYKQMLYITEKTPRLRYRSDNPLKQLREEMAVYRADYTTRISSCAGNVRSVLLLNKLVNILTAVRYICFSKRHNILSVRGGVL